MQNIWILDEESGFWSFKTGTSYLHPRTADVPPPRHTAPQLAADREGVVLAGVRAAWQRNTHRTGLNLKQFIPTLCCDTWTESEKRSDFDRWADRFLLRKAGEKFNCEAARAGGKDLTARRPGRRKKIWLMWWGGTPYLAPSCPCSCRRRGARGSTLCGWQAAWIQTVHVQAWRLTSLTRPRPPGGSFEHVWMRRQLYT